MAYNYFSNVEKVGEVFNKGRFLLNVIKEMKKKPFFDNPCFFLYATTRGTRILSRLPWPTWMAAPFRICFRLILHVKFLLVDINIQKKFALNLVLVTFPCDSFHSFFILKSQIIFMSISKFVKSVFIIVYTSEDFLNCFAGEQTLTRRKTLNGVETQCLYFVI